MSNIILALAWLGSVVYLTKSYGNETGTLYVVVSAISFIFLNLGERKAGEASAYSVYNRQGRGILGSETNIDNELRGGLETEGPRGNMLASHGDGVGFTGSGRSLGASGWHWSSSSFGCI